MKSKLAFLDNDNRTPESTDRLMVAVCGGIWVVWLIIAAISCVALINLGRGHQAAEGSPWLLYTVIAVSALVIIGAIPLLLKARRAALESREAAGEGASRAETPAAVAPSAPTVPVADAPTEKLRVFGTSVDPGAGRHAQPEPTALPANGFVERVWLRGTTSLLGAMGLAMIGVSTATYLLTAAADVGAWVALGIAAVITAAMPAILLAFQRQLVGTPGAHEAPPVND